MTEPPPSTLGEILERAVFRLRIGMEGAGGLALAELVDAFMREHAGRAFPELVEIVGAMERGDYLRVADLLEYEVAPHLT